MARNSAPQLKIPDDSMINEAIEFLRDNHGCLPAIAEDMGVPVGFFYDLTANRVKNPGVRHIEKILRYKQMTGEAISSGLLS
jgi:hypothetical protein